MNISIAITDLFNDKNIKLVELNYINKSISNINKPDNQKQKSIIMLSSNDDIYNIFIYRYINYCM